MDGGENMQSNEERAAEKLMDDYLKTLGLHRKKIAKDGSCLFRAVAEQVLHCQSLHTEVRAKCVEFLKQNRGSYEAFIEGNFEDYLCKLQDPQQWVGEVEINALAVMYKRDFVIYQEPGKPAVNITDNNFKDKVQLCFLNRNHYDSVYPISHISNTALCQSILYELLYTCVFKVDRSILGSHQRSGRSPVLSDDNMATCASSDESELDADEPLWVEDGTSTTSTRRSNQSCRGRGRGRQLSERVRRSLNPTLLRNVEYDVWQKTKRAQQKLDYCIAAGMHYNVGDRCQVRLEGSGRSYNATIKELTPNNGPVTVYIEDLGKRQVPLWGVRPLHDENSWSIVVNRDKKLSNGHGEWEEKGKGRGRGKSIPASSSGYQTTAPGSGGRIQKQHSWPPQPTAVEQGGAKTSRKSLNSAESVLFGLTEQERLAKEEEKRNVALVEIQLRDEHSFPALGTQPGMQGDGGRRKGGEKKKSLRNKTKSPVEDIGALPPSAVETPRSSTPPLPATTATAAPTTNTTTPINPTQPAAKPPAALSANSESSAARRSSLKASMPSISMAATASGSSSSLPPAIAAPTDKTNTQSYALAAGATPNSPVAASPSTKPSGVDGAPPNIPSSAAVFSFVTPVLPTASSLQALPALSSPSPPPSSSSLPPKSSVSPPPSSSVPPPTFISPIAPSPGAAQGFLQPSSVPRSSPPIPPLPHSPCPPSSSSLIHHSAQVQEAPPAPAITPISLAHAEGPMAASQTLQSQTSLSQIHLQASLPQNQSQISVSQTQTQASLQQAEKPTQPSLHQIQTQSQGSLPENKTLMPQMRTEVQPSLPDPQPYPQSHTEVASLPQNQASLSQLQASFSHLKPQYQAQYTSQSQSEVSQVQSAHSAPEVSCSHTTQASIPASVQPQPSVTQPHLPSQLVQPPHPSQVPHPSLSLSYSVNPTPGTQDKTEAPAPQPQPESSAPPTQQSHPHHPQLHSVHPPPHPQPIPGAVPLQQLSQLFQDPLYPGFPQGEKGDVAPTPPYSSSKSGDDLPQDVNVLRFFFNLGVKAYSMPMYPPCIYLIPLQQAYTVQPKLPSRSPSPASHYPPSNLQTREQEPYPQYPPVSVTQYDHQAPLTEPPCPSEPSFTQTRYPVSQPPPHRMPWQQHQMPPPRNSSYPVGYPSPAPPYPSSLPSSQVYPPSQGPGHPRYPPAITSYPPSSLGYYSSEELQVNQGAMEQLQHTNGDTIPGHVPGPLDGPANANNSRTVGVPGLNSFALKKEQGEGMTRAVLLVDPPLQNKPIVALVSNSDVGDVSVTTLRPSSGSGPRDIISKATNSGDNIPARSYRPRKPFMHNFKTFVKPGALEPGQGGYLPPPIMPEPLSVGCSTEDYWEDTEGFKHTTLNFRGPRKTYRGGGRGGHDGGRGGYRRRQGGDAGAVYKPGPYGPSHGGRGY
uniref:ubiquitinyl hydrolase 1 n=1 Tax=Monopterus albus TaxID=43700 RepID=A0A3Q3Q7G2_MONAL|nr:OTU domain-containing protein 4 [Monopterus albus]